MGQEYPFLAMLMPFHASLYLATALRVSLESCVSILFYSFLFCIFLNVKGFFFSISQPTIITIAYNSNLHNFISSDFTFLVIQFRVVDYIQRKDENKMLVHENIFLRID